LTSNQAYGYSVRVKERKMEYECETCKDQGIVIVGKSVFKTTKPCNVCGKDHGYFQHMRNLYSTNLPSGAHIRDNIYELNLQKRQRSMYEEAGRNNGFLPIKSDGDNVYHLNDYRKRKDGES
jgi:ssDNA-binding Zn-finger/Zn-ribbon topoisomerase 1